MGQVKIGYDDKLAITSVEYFYIKGEEFSKLERSVRFAGKNVPGTFNFVDPIRKGSVQKGADVAGAEIKNVPSMLRVISIPGADNE